MRKGTFAIVATIALLAAWGGWHVLGLVLAGLGLFGAYWASLIVHPRTRHGACNGTGEHRGAIFGWAHRKCPRCDGGRVIRLGAGQFGSAPVRGEYVRRRDARRSARSGGTWR